MARIRSIKPEICTSTQFVECSPNARLLFVLLWLFCDDGGRHPANPKQLKMEAFPADDFTTDQISEWISEMKCACDEGGIPLLSEYEVDGKGYWQVTGWDRHQKVDKPYYKHPDENGITPDSWNIRRTFSEHSDKNGNERTETKESKDSYRSVNVTGDGDEHRFLSEGRELLADAMRKLRATPKRGDQELLFKVCVMVARGTVSRDFLEDSIAATTNGDAKNNRWAYLVGVFKRRAKKELQAEFGAMLAAETADLSKCNGAAHA